MYYHIKHNVHATFYHGSRLTWIVRLTEVSTDMFNLHILRFYLVRKIWRYLKHIVHGQENQLYILIMCLFRNFRKLIFFKLPDTVTFQTNTSFMVKKLQISISFESNNIKWCLCYLLFYKMVETTNSKRGFHWFLPNYTEFGHETSHIQLSNKYGSTSGTKSPYSYIMFEKNWGMRLWIGTSTFTLVPLLWNKWHCKQKEK